MKENKSRHLKIGILAAGLVLLAIFGASLAAAADSQGGPGDGSGQAGGPRIGMGIGDRQFQGNRSWNGTDDNNGSRNGTGRRGFGEFARGIRGQIISDFVHWRDELMKKRSEFNVERDQFGQARLQLKELRDSGELRKKVLTNQTLNVSQGLLISANRMMITSLETLEARIQADSLLDNGTKQGILDAIAGRIDSLQALQGQIGSATTKDALQNISRQMQDAVKDNRLFLRSSAHSFETSQLETVINKTMSIEARIQGAIDSLGANGTNTTHLQEQFALFKGKVDAAEQARIAADAKFALAGNDVNDTQDIQAAQDLLAQARKDLSEARDILQGIVREIATRTRTQWTPHIERNETENGTNSSV